MPPATTQPSTSVVVTTTPPTTMVTSGAPTGATTTTTTGKFQLLRLITPAVTPWHDPTGLGSYEGQLKQMEQDAKDKTVKEGIRKVLNYIQHDWLAPY